MSHYWPPDDDPESSRQDRSRPLYGPPSQGRGQRPADYGPPSQRRDRPNPDYGPPSQRRSGGGWSSPEEGSWPQPAPEEAQRGASGYAQYPQYPQYQPYPEQSQYSQYPQYQQYSQYSPYSQYPSYQQSAYGSPYGYGPSVEEPRRGTNWLLPIVIVVLLVLVGGGAAGAYALTHRGLQGSASNTATPTIPAGFHMYTDAATHIQFAIPRDWSTQGSVSGSTGLLVGSQDHKSAFVVKQVNLVGSASDDAQAADAFLTGAVGSGSVTHKAGPANVKLAGATWVQESGDLTSNGITLHAVVLVATHADATYLIAYLSQSSSFSSANTQYFQPVLKSFAFTQ